MRTEAEKEYLIRAIDASGQTFIIVSTEFEIIAANKFTMGLYPDFIGKNCHEHLYGLGAPCENCAAIKAMELKQPALRDRNNGDTYQHWKSCRFSYPIYSEKNNDIEAMAMIDFERTSSEEMEGKLKRTNAFLRNLILSSVDGVIAADKTGKILVFNEAAAEISSYSIKEALDNLDIRDFYPGDKARDIMKKLRSDDYGGKGKLKSYQVDVLRKHGETIPINLNAAIVYEGKKEVASIGFFHDMRDELKMKSDLEKTQGQLLQAEKMSSLGKLSAGVAHQLNNPLGGITLFAKLILEEYELEKNLSEDINRILQDAQRCRDTVKELLEFARQTSHMIRPQNINEALARTLFLLENQSLFQNIKIDKNFSTDLPQVPVDIQQMNHVFMNIILNAAQAMDGDGKLKLKTSRSKNKERVIIEISDTGPGIPEDALEHIFEPFFTTKEEGKGTGLGLSMVYGIIENHGGKISAHSKAGKETTFIIELPLTVENREGENSGE